MNTDELKKRFENQRSNKFTIVLNDNELNNLKSAKHILDYLITNQDLCIVYIAVICHDRDIEDGHVKTKHYHLVIHFNNNYRIRTVMNILEDTFMINDNQISIDKCTSLEAQSRYLLHIDDYEKEKYFESEVLTNDRDTFNRFINKVIVRDLHDLIAVVKHYNYNLEDIMVNISNYDYWRKYINDLIINQYRRKF